MLAIGYFSVSLKNRAQAGGVSVPFKTAFKCGSKNQRSTCKSTKESEFSHASSGALLTSEFSPCLLPLIAYCLNRYLVRRSASAQAEALASLWDASGPV